MDPNELPAQPAEPQTEASPIEPERRPNGLRRAVLTAGMAAALLIAGGVAAVSAASPDPSATPTPATTTQPSTGGSSAPSKLRTTQPGRSRQLPEHGQRWHHERDADPGELAHRPDSLPSRAVSADPFGGRSSRYAGYLAPSLRTRASASRS